MRDLSDILAEVNVKIAAAAKKSGRRAEDVEIIAVTKTHSEDVVREAWEAGLRIVGENKVQEAAWKQPLSVSGPDWHLIGHLQKNKVRPALELFSCLHSVDSVALIERIQRVAEELGARPSILLEVNMSGERSKSGMRPEDAAAAVEASLRCPNLTLEGFMTMAPFTPQEKIEQTRPVFAGLRELRDAMEEEFNACFPRLSMGMSGDYEIAIEEGATWVRLGTVLFGERPKAKLVRAIDAGDAGESGEGGGAFDRILD
ncbi:MAG: YggS family pyridoxal phosphate-dependent enzyme [Kiritimatiellae bacterium]|nr:YggS family pyridoxal phosphate-dependent enzyme [Kiritimatiellia bacterium]